jgi:homotetrameric cytidine deaminase
MHDRRNVELKAHDPDPDATLRAALALDGIEDRGVLRQRDTYFRAPRGRLKLRRQDDSAQLIAYARADAPGARQSAYRLVDVADPDALAAALESTYGVSVDVVKERRLLLWDGVRIHLDRVEGLGRFVELEAVAPADSDLSAEHEKVARLRQALDIRDDRLEPRGYAALLQGAGAGELVDAARAAMQRAYVPYSRFPVGAALRDERGTIHAAANVENAAYPQGQCAEASAIGVLIAAGGARITEVAVAGRSELITPCGGCRQRLREFAAPDVKVHLCGPEGVRRTVAFGELLPLSFGPDDLADAAAGGGPPREEPHA